MSAPCGHVVHGPNHSLLDLRKEQRVFAHRMTRLSCIPFSVAPSVSPALFTCLQRQALRQLWFLPSFSSILETLSVAVVLCASLSARSQCGGYSDPVVSQACLALPIISPGGLWSFPHILSTCLGRLKSAGLLFMACSALSVRNLYCSRRHGEVFPRISSTDETLAWLSGISVCGRAVFWT